MQLQCVTTTTIANLCFVLKNHYDNITCVCIVDVPTGQICDNKIFIPVLAIMSTVASCVCDVELYCSESKLKKKV